MALTIQIIRDLVSDIDATDPLLPDPSYQTIIDLGETNAYRAAAVACRQLGALFAPKVDVKATPVQIWNSQKSKAYNDLAIRYDYLADQGLGDTSNGGASTSFAPVVTGVNLDEMLNVAEDTARFPSSFTMGMDDNPGSEDDPPIKKRGDGDGGYEHS